MALIWPASVKPVSIRYRPVRGRRSFVSPISGEETMRVSPFSKFEIEATFKPLRSAQAWDAIAAILLSETDVVRFPFCLPGHATGTASLQATGSNSSLVVTQVGTSAASRPFINGGTGFKAGQNLALLHNGQNYMYTVAANQTNNNVLLTSRLRGGSIGSVVPITYNPPFIEGELDEQSRDIGRDDANFYGFTIRLRELK
jgi:hypothetical protein